MHSVKFSLSDLPKNVMTNCLTSSNKLFLKDPQTNFYRIHVSIIVFGFFNRVLNNYLMRSSRIWGIIEAEVCVFCQNRRLRQITQTEALIIPHILREPNSIFFLFFCI